MSLSGAWLRCLLPPAFQPESSRSALPPLRRSLLAALLSLPLLTLLATGAAAQTTVTFASGTYRVNEGDVLRPELVLSHARSEDVTVMVETLDLGGARSREDFDAGPWSVTVPAGNTRHHFSIPTNDDNQREGDEEVLLHISPYGHSSGVKRGSGTADAIVVIRDDDSRISLPKWHYIVSEGGTATIDVAIENPKPTSFTLNYEISAAHVDPGLPGGTASAADVVGGFGTRSVTVQANARRVNLPVETVQDNTPDGGKAGIERFSVRLSTTESDVEFGRRVANISISEHGAEPRVTFAWPTSNTSEASIRYPVEVILSPAPEMDAVVQVLELNRVSGGAGRATPDADYRIQLGDAVRRISKSIVEIDVPAGASSVLLPVNIIDDSDPEGNEAVELRIWIVYVEGRLHDDRQMTPNERHTLTIVDNDIGVSFAEASQSAGEGAGNKNVRVNLSRAPASAITVNYTVSGTATAGSDFTIASSGTLSVPGGMTTATIPVSILPDGVEDGSETVILTLAEGSGYRVSSPDTHTLHIDPMPEVTFDRWVKVVNEGVGTVDVKVNLSPAPASDLTLNYEVDEAFSTATPNADYQVPSGTLPVTAGSTSATIPVTITDDSHEDSREWINLRIRDGEGYRLGPRWRLGHTVFILNHDDLEGLIQTRIDEAATNGDTASGNLWRRALAAVRGEAPPNGLAPLTEAEAQAQADAETARGNAGLASVWRDIASIAGAATPESPSVPEVAIAAGADVAEGGDAVFTLTASPAPESPLTVDVTVAEAGGYAAAGTRRVTIPTGGSAVLTVATVDDAADEPDGTVTAALAAGAEYTVSATAGSAGVAVTDGDATAVTLSAPAGAIVEGSGRKTLTLTLGRALVAGESVTVPLTLGGAAALGSDYTLAAPDATPQGVSHAHLGSTDAAHPPALTFTGPSATAATVIVAAVADAADEGAGEQVTVAPGTLIATGLGGGASGAGSVAFAIAEPAPVVVSIAPGAGVSEGEDATFTLSAAPAPAPASALSVTLAVSEGAGSDFVDAGGEGTATVVIPGGATGATFTVATVDDTTDEPDGTVTAVLAAGAGYTVSATAGSAGVAVADDDAPATPTGVDPALIAEVKGHIAHFKARNHGAGVRDWTLVLDRLEGRTGMTDAAIAAWLARSRLHGWQDGVQTLPKVQAALAALEAAPEPVQQPATLPEVTVAAGNAVTEGGDAVFTFTADPAPGADLSVSVTVAASGDYGIAGASQTVTIPTTGSFTLTLATANDAKDEPDGSVTVTVADGAGYTVGSSASGSVAIRDDDEPLPEVTIAAGDAVTEGGDAVFTLTASPLPASPLSVSVTVAASGDYGIAGESRTVTIPPTGSFTLTLATADDAADEPDGSVTVTVNDGDGYTVGSSASGTVSVQDDDLPPPAVSITAAAASVTEGGAASFTVTADRAPDADLTVTLSVTEAAGGDHVAADDEGTATVTIAKGGTQAVFSVATVNDAVDEPDGSVTVTVNDGAGYTVSSSQGAATVSVSDDDAAATGPVLSVADATERESGQRHGISAMEFTVRLSAAAQTPVRVYVATRPSSPVSARPKKDYWPGSYALTFRPGETSKQVYILIYNDSHDEDPETFEVVLSDADGAMIGDGVAVGTIVNDDPMPAAWLARFGRTVAEQALDGIAARMAAPRTAGMQGTLAGQALDFSGAADPSRSSGTLSPGLLSGAGFGGETAAQSRSMTMDEVLRGSSFSLTGEADGSGGTLAFWGGTPGAGGLVSGSQFAGSDASVRLDGETSAALLGTDYARGKWLVGFALSQSRAEGGYAGEGVSGCSGLPEAVPESACAAAAQAGDGEVEASLTATIPYAALAVSERLKLWGAAGHGTGDVTVKTGPGGSYRADTAWSMAAAGLRGDLLASPVEGSGPALALTSDALWVRTSSEKTSDLAASESDVSRLRVGLEGSWGLALAGGGHLTPKLEAGARHDGGDAETGFGVELGGGLAWRDPKLGLTLDLSGRTLVAHDDGGLEDRGVSAQLSFDPEPASGRGLSFGLGQDWGGRSAGGLDALFAPEPLEDRTGGSEAAARWSMEAAYGFPALGGHFTGSPYMGLGLATAVRDYSLGWRLTPEAANAPGLSFGLRATRRESGSAVPEHVLGIEATARW